ASVFLQRLGWEAFSGLLPIASNLAQSFRGGNCTPASPLGQFAALAALVNPSAHSGRRNLDEFLNLLGGERLIEKLELHRIAHGALEVLHLSRLQGIPGLIFGDRLLDDVLVEAVIFCVG